MIGECTTTKRVVPLRTPGPDRRSTESHCLIWIERGSQPVGASTIGGNTRHSEGRLYPTLRSPCQLAS